MTQRNQPLTSSDPGLRLRCNVEWCGESTLSRSSVTMLRAYYQLSLRHTDIRRMIMIAIIFLRSQTAYTRRNSITTRLLEPIFQTRWKCRRTFSAEKCRDANSLLSVSELSTRPAIMTRLYPLTSGPLLYSSTNRASKRFSAKSLLYLQRNLYSHRPLYKTYISDR